jgi:hypothetical protein
MVRNILLIQLQKTGRLGFFFKLKVGSDDTPSDQKLKIVEKLLGQTWRIVPPIPDKMVVEERIFKDEG